mmetsp:Transcript_104770/g.165410  ORF Transcript_104770/g.165410 Transcript_104770/m.165410 type:complete len:82 (-) Transcript_104770:106-351(-)
MSRCAQNVSMTCIGVMDVVAWVMSAFDVLHSVCSKVVADLVLRAFVHLVWIVCSSVNNVEEEIFAVIACKAAPSVESSAAA